MMLFSGGVVRAVFCWALQVFRETLVRGKIKRTWVCTWVGNDRVAGWGRRCC